MGTWGNGILQDDTVLDVIEEFKKYLKESSDVVIATTKTIEKNKDILDDEDSALLFWIALAKCQWEYGKLDPLVFESLVKVFESEKWVGIWDGVTKKDFEKRKQIISELIEKLKSENCKIKKIPKSIKRKPIFKAGDCLSFKVDDEYFGAALVIQSDESNEEIGANLICALDYWEKEEIEIEKFKNARIQYLNFGSFKNEKHMFWYGCMGFAPFKSRIKIIGNIEVNKYEYEKSQRYAVWGTLMKYIEIEKKKV